MAKRRRKSTRQQLSPAATIILLVVIGIVLAIAALREEGLPPQVESVMQTAAAEAGVSIGLPTHTPIVYTDPGGALAVFFTNPASRQAGEALEAAMVQTIDSTQRTLDVAIYNISNENLGDALIRAHRRGVRVRMVMESEAMERTIPAGLQAAGIPIVGDQREGLMHNKFIIADGREVWTGSTNFTNSALFQDFNNMVRIQSEQMAQNYLVNFEEMFIDRRFGPAKQPNTPSPRVVVGQIPVEAYFSPDDGVAARLVEEIRSARSSIHFLAYSYTRDDFAEAMIDQAGRGVRVRGVFDNSQNASNIGGEYANLRENGLDVRLDGISGLLHDKVLIIDQQVVITGSYNFSASAERNNDENLVIIRDAAVANQYLQHFERVYATAQP